jgi:hypothetical protein
MCHTSEGTRTVSHFRVIDGEDIPGCEETVFEVEYLKNRATAAGALRHLMLHHLGGREIASFTVDPTVRKRLVSFGQDSEEFLTLVVLTKKRS